MPPLKKPPKEEAIALTRGPYATEMENEIAGSVAPFLWRERDEKDHLKIRNGTAFFVSAVPSGRGQSAIKKGCDFRIERSTVMAYFLILHKDG